MVFNPLNTELNPICHLLALLGAHHIIHVSRVRINYHYTALIYLLLSFLNLSCRGLWRYGTMLSCSVPKIPKKWTHGFGNGICFCPRVNGHFLCWAPGPQLFWAPHVRLSPLYTPMIGFVNRK